MTPAEAIIDALETVAARREAEATRSSWNRYEDGSGELLMARALDAVDRMVAESLRDVAQEFAMALGMER